MADPRLKHNPSRMSDAALIRDFVVRHADLELVLERLRDEPAASNQHLLIRGPRGIGKTTLVNRVIAEIRRDPALGERWYPIAFNEESYTVTSAAELWLQALVHLGEQTRDPGLERMAAELRRERDDARLRDRALARLLEFADAQRRRLLVVIENIDMLFEEQMSDEDGWDIRHTLQNEPRIMVLATSATRLSSFHEADKPLYEIFWELALEPLDREEIREVWRMVSDTELDPHPARSIQILTGGNTRLLVILASFARGRSFRELVTELVALIDENTPAFKHHVELLPPEERKIFVSLADLWSPSTSRQVAEYGRSDVRNASALLGRLERRGLVEEAGRREGAKLYQVTERMYNLYHLLRRRSHERVRAFIAFIVAFYDPRPLAGVLPGLADEARDGDAACSGRDDLAGPLPDRWDEAEIAVRGLLARRERIASRIGAVLPLLLGVAAKGSAAELLPILEGSASAPLFEPLLVALRRLVGRADNPPRELQEVADDVLARIELFRATGHSLAKSLTAPPLQRSLPPPAASASARERAAPPTRGRTRRRRRA